MNFVYDLLYGRFAFAAFLSGITGGIGSSLVTSDSRTTDVVSGFLYAIAAALFAAIHGVLAEIDSRASTASAVSGGLIAVDSLVTEQLKNRSKRVLVLLCSAILSLAGAILTRGWRLFGFQ